jgi:LAO/AO transport system kinase
MVERLRAGDVRALARALSVVEDGGAAAAELVEACRVYAGGALRVGVTGPPGAGKSTLVDQMVRFLRREGKTVGVVAVDPSSPYTGGALLGDRIRMQGFVGDDGVFIRSMASRGALGGVARAVEDVCVVMEAAGRERVLIETVGVGQDEVGVIGVADVTVLVLVPGMGDEVQSLKAGVMEVADIFVVNKSDRGGAELVEQEILAMQGLVQRATVEEKQVSPLRAARSGRNDDVIGGGEWVAPVVRTVATTGEGVGELMEAVGRCAAEKLKCRFLRQAQDRLFDFASRDETARACAQDDTSLSIEHSTGALRLDHLGVAVKSIAAARGFYEALGLVVSHEETVEHERVRTAMLPLGESRIELLEATEEDSVIGRFVAKRGEGLHHVAVNVEDADAMFTRLTGDGVKLASDSVRVGAGGHRYFFVHPASTGGVLLEIVSPQRASSPGAPIVGDAAAEGGE